MTSNIHESRHMVTSGSEVILTKLTVDQRRRIFVSKEAGELLNILPGDELVLSKKEGSESIFMRIQRGGHIAEVLILSAF